MADPTLRGRCKEMAEAACATDPNLTLVRGWYVDPWWGRQEHWWTTHPDGSIYDPTAAQFPMGGVAEWYEPFDGRWPCIQCGTEVPEAVAASNSGCCSGRCFGAMVGIFVPAAPSGGTP